MNPEGQQGIDMNAISQALQKRVTNPTQQQQPPEGGQKVVKSGPGFDNHTKVLSKALIHKLLTIV